jgi:hypothetical protein
MTLARDPSDMAKKFIDASLQASARNGRTRQPSKAAYTRAIRLAQDAIEELTAVARRAQGSPSR